MRVLFFWKSGSLLVLSLRGNEAIQYTTQGTLEPIYSFIILYYGKSTRKKV